MNLINIVLLLFYVIAGIHADTETQDKCMDARHHDFSGFKIHCHEGEVLYHLEVESGNATTCPSADDTGTCTGLSADLISSQNQCYWKKSCTISWPQQRLITDCYHEEVGILRVKNTPKCIRENDVHPICDDSNGDLVTGPMGMIPSHRHYPWCYEGIAFDNTSSCEKRYDLSRLCPQHKLLVTTRTLDLAETEYLTYEHPDGHETSATNSTATFSRSAAMGNNLTFRFGGITETKGGQGFILCYKVYPGHEGNADVDVCEEIASRDAQVNKYNQWEQEGEQATRNKRSGKNAGRRRGRKNNGKNKQKAHVKKICDRKELPDLTNSPGGLIVSDKRQYTRKLFNRRRTCVKTLDLSTLPDDHTLWLSMKMLDMPDTEYLYFSNEEQQTINCATDSTHQSFPAGGQLKISFTGDPSTSGGKGFALCYKVLPKDKHPDKGSLCSEKQYTKVIKRITKNKNKNG